MSRRTPDRQRGRRIPRPITHSLLAELGWDVPWPVVSWSLVILALGFGPLLIATLTDAAGISLQVLTALGPVLVCLAFAGLTWKYGMIYASETGKSKRGIWLLVALFVALAALVGWALFVSV